MEFFGFIDLLGPTIVAINGGTEILKRTFGLGGVWGYVLSALIALVAALPGLDSGILNYGMLTLFSWLSANGFYKMVKD